MTDFQVGDRVKRDAPNDHWDRSDLNMYNGQEYIVTEAPTNRTIKVSGCASFWDVDNFVLIARPTVPEESNWQDFDTDDDPRAHLEKYGIEYEVRQQIRVKRSN